MQVSEDFDKRVRLLLMDNSFVSGRKALQAFDAGNYNGVLAELERFKSLPYSAGELLTLMNEERYEEITKRAQFAFECENLWSELVAFCQR